MSNTNKKNLSEYFKKLASCSDGLYLKECSELSKYTRLCLTDNYNEFFKNELKFEVYWDSSRSKLDIFLHSNLLLTLPLDPYTKYSDIEIEFYKDEKGYIVFCIKVCASFIHSEELSIIEKRKVCRWFFKPNLCLIERIDIPIIGESKFSSICNLNTEFVVGDSIEKITSMFEFSKGIVK